MCLPLAPSAMPRQRSQGQGGGGQWPHPPAGSKFSEKGNMAVRQEGAGSPGRGNGGDEGPVVRYGPMHSGKSRLCDVSRIEEERRIWDQAGGCEGGGVRRTSVGLEEGSAEISTWPLANCVIYQLYQLVTQDLPSAGPQFPCVKCSFCSMSL